MPYADRALKDTRRKLILRLIRAIQPVQDLTMLHSFVFLLDQLLTDKKLPRFGYTYVNRRGSPYSAQLTLDLMDLDHKRALIEYDRDGIHLTEKGEATVSRMKLDCPPALGDSLKLLDDVLSELHDRDQLGPYIDNRASRYVRNQIGHRLELARTGS